MRTRVTVRLGDMLRVTVPCEEDMRIDDLISAASARFHRITNADVSIRFLQSLRTGGIFDPDDRLCDVFDFTDQVPHCGKTGMCGDKTNADSFGKSGVESENVGFEIVAIPDASNETPPALGGSASTRLGGDSSLILESQNRWNNGGNDLKNAVEVSSLIEPPSHGLRVGGDAMSPSRSGRRSPRFAPSPAQDDGTKALNRDETRKSRITDAWLDARERLETSATTARSTTLQFTFPSTDRPLGLKILPVHDATGQRLRGVKVVAIDGRLGDDGRVRVGDLILEINGRPIYQMSLSRVGEYLQELDSRAEFSLTLEGAPRDGDLPPSAATLNRRPVFSALQQANTSQIGQTIPVQLKKDDASLGFTIASRETAKNERLFYIKTVTLGGSADGLLRSGDRLLEVNGEQVSSLSHEGALERLRRVSRGDTVSLLVSRLDAPDPPTQTANVVSRPSQKDANALVQQIVSLSIALNDTGSAGLGVSVKGRTVQRADGSREECGIFVKKVLTGGAASKDGRLKVNDRLVGIENVDLTKAPSNAAAMRAITNTLSRVATNAPSVKLTLARAIASSQVSRLPSHMEWACKSQPESLESAGTLDDGDSMLLMTRSTPHGGNGEIVKRPVQDHPRADQPTTGATSILDYDVVDDDEEIEQGDVFVRETRARRSMSEKRHLGAGNDAAHTLTFQKIQHSRQHSAPSMEESGVTREQVETGSRRGRGQTAGATRSPPALVSPLAGNRRLPGNSLGDTPMIHELAAARSSSRTSKIGERRTRERNAPAMRGGVDGGDDRVVPVPTGDANPSSPVTPQERQHRRNGFFSKNWFSRLGSSRSREVSPEKTIKEDNETREERARRTAAEERSRIQEQYEILRLKEAAKRAPGHSEKRRRAPPPPVDASEATAGFIRPGFEPSPDDAERVLRVANSRFYRSLDRYGHIAQYRPTPPPRIPHSFDINNIATRPDNVAACQLLHFSTLTHSPPPLCPAGAGITTTRSTRGSRTAAGNINPHLLHGRPRSATTTGYSSIYHTDSRETQMREPSARPQLPVVFPTSRFMMRPPPQRPPPPAYSTLRNSSEHGKSTTVGRPTSLHFSEAETPAYC